MSAWSPASGHRVVSRLAAVAGAAAVAAAPVAVHAQSVVPRTGTLQVNLSTGIAEIPPGKTVRGVGILANGTSATVTAKLFPAAAVQLPNGGYKLVGAQPWARWIHLGGYTFTIPTLKEVRFSYSVTVPRGTPAGAYVLGIVATVPNGSVTQHAHNNVSIHVAVESQEGAYIIVRTPGALRYAARLAGWRVARQGPSLTLDTTLMNKSNTYAYAEARLTVRTGAHRFRTAPETVLVLAHCAVQLQFDVPKVEVGRASVGTVAVQIPHRSLTASGPMRVNVTPAPAQAKAAKKRA